MSKIAIVTDVNAGLDYIGYDPQIPVLRSVINFGDEHLVDGIDIKADEFYARLKEIDKDKSKAIPSTSAPTIGETMALFDKLVEEGYTDVIMFAISFKLSSIGSMVLSLVDEYEGRLNVHVVDTKTSAFMQGYLAVNAKKMVEEGKSVEEILAYTDHLVNNQVAYFVVDDLKYLVKNGRLSGFSGTLGTWLQVKPMLEINPEGYIVTKEKIRTFNKAVDKLVSNILDYTKNTTKAKAFIFHTCRIEDANMLKEKLIEARPDLFSDVEIHIFTPAVGAHIGYSIVGFGVFKVEEK